MPLSLGGNGVISGIDWAGTGGGLAHIATTSFSAASTVSVDGCFTSTYDAYRVTISATSSAGAINLTYRMRVSGVDNSAASYNDGDLEANSTTVSGSRLTGQTSGRLAYMRSTDRVFVSADIFNPANTSPTGFLVLSNQSSGTMSAQIHTSAHDSNTAFDGFTLIPASGTITGTVRVYGYIND